MEIEPSLFSVKVAAPPMAVFSAVTILPMVWPAAVVMLAVLAMSPSGPFSATVMVAPAAKPRNIRRRKTGGGQGRHLGLKDVVQPEELREARAAAQGRRGGVILHQDAVAAGGGDGKLAVGEGCRAVRAQRRVQRGR